MIQEGRKGGGAEPAMSIGARIILLNFLSASHRALMYQQFFVYIFSVEYVALIFSSLDED